MRGTEYSGGRSRDLYPAILASSLCVFLLFGAVTLWTSRAIRFASYERAKKLGVPVIPIHRAVLSVRQDADTIPQKLHPGNPAGRKP